MPSTSTKQPEDSGLVEFLGRCYPIACRGRRCSPIAFGIELAPTPETSVIAPEFRRRRLADLVVELLAALLPGPSVILVEDAHWVDDASAELLSAVAPRRAESTLAHVDRASTCETT